MNVRLREDADQAAAQAFLARHNSLRVARLGELVHSLDYPAFVAEAADGQLLGMLTYVPGRDWRQCEILTLHAGEQWHGAGTALIEAAGQLARRQGCSRLWIITTNDNVDALRFYQRRGFCLVRVHRDAVDRSRAQRKGDIVMSDLWFLGSADPWADGGFSGPDPVTIGNTSWTWDVEFSTNNNQWTYARSSLNTFALIGGGSGWVTSGIVQYRTRSSGGTDTLHPVGQSDQNGVVDFINDRSVDSVTFGWSIEGDNFCQGKINMEIWVSG